MIVIYIEVITYLINKTINMFAFEDLQKHLLKICEWMLSLNVCFFCRLCGCGFWSGVPSLAETEKHPSQRNQNYTFQ